MLVEILTQVDLSKQNTMALPCVAGRLIRLYSEERLSELDTLLGDQHPFILGGGSNVILPTKLKRPVLQYLNTDTHYSELDNERVLVEAGAGVEWDQLVLETVRRGLRGIENLSFIPGSVGAAPVQNIGAYGVELADVLSYVRVYDLESKQVEMLSCDQCCFAYRDSLFKQNPGKYLILKVGLILSRTKDFTLSYGELVRLGTKPDLTAQVVRNEVIRIRQAKLPDPQQLPNAGSFFKNPVVTNEQKEKLHKQFPELVSYPLGESKSKLAAGWLIDHAGWKGFRQNGIGIHEGQALVIANYGESTQQDVLALADRVKRSVSEKFGVSLEIEPVVVA